MKGSEKLLAILLFCAQIAITRAIIEKCNAHDNELVYILFISFVIDIYKGINVWFFYYDREGLFTTKNWWIWTTPSLWVLIIIKQVIKLADKYLTEE